MDVYIAICIIFSILNYYYSSVKTIIDNSFVGIYTWNTI